MNRIISEAITADQIVCCTRKPKDTKNSHQIRVLMEERKNMRRSKYAQLQELKVQTKNISKAIKGDIRTNKVLEIQHTIEKC